MNGQLLWQKDLGVLDAGFYMAPEAQWETGSSPMIHDGLIFIQADVQKGSFLAAFDARTGAEKWRVARTDVPTWSTPTVHRVNGARSCWSTACARRAATTCRPASEIWKLSGGGDIPVPTPVAGDGLIYITNAHGPMAPVYAIRDTASGDVSLADGATSNAGVAWSYPRDGGYMCTPLVYRGLVYIVKFNGVLQRVRRQDRRDEIPGTARRRDLRLHRVAGGERRQGLSGERRRSGLRAEGGTDVRAAVAERHGSERAGDAGHLRGPLLLHPRS